VELDGVHLAHEPGQPVLRGLDLRVDPGETVAVVGPSGSGKSTVVALLLRLLDPDSGTVRLDGVDVRRTELAELRSQVALVQQDAVVFAGTVEENIRQGRPDAPADEVREAARLARVEQFTDALPDGLRTLVAERGANLSGGQRQRISLARAFLRDAPVLVLDEPTTGLDPDNVALVTDAIVDLARGRTCLIVTHDPRTARTADRVVVVDGGRVTWDGPAALAPLDGLLDEDGIPLASDPTHARSAS
jgi:ATP-binding cassette subfamily B protein